MENKDIPNTNIKEGISSSTSADVKVVDMSGTNVPDATNNKSAEKTPAREDKPEDKTEKLEKVRLTSSHTHEGIQYDDGEVIEVDAQSAKYIVDFAKSGVRV